jgi:hypothetical protein
MDFGGVLNCVKLVGPLLSPVDLMAMSRLSKKWYKAVRHVYPTFNLQASLRNVVGPHINDLLSAGCYIFGSTLVHAIHYTPGSVKPMLNDIDLFYPVKSIAGARAYLKMKMKSEFMQEIVKNHSVQKIKSYNGWRVENKVVTYELVDKAGKTGKKRYDLNLIQTNSEVPMSERIDTIIRTSYYDMQRNYCYLQDGKFVFKSFGLLAHVSKIATYKVECEIDHGKIMSYSQIFKKFRYDLTSAEVMIHVAYLRKYNQYLFSLQDTFITLHL